MKGYRFYLEYRSTTHKKNNWHEGTVIAIMPENSWLANKDWIAEGVGSVTSTPNSPVQSCNASWNYVHKYCKRISEKRAREIHPALFEYLDYNP